MEPRNPPRLAAALLEWFGLARDEAFAGDLVEEFHNGRTAGWFWRQTLTAVSATMWKIARRDDVSPLILGYLVIPILVAFFHTPGKFLLVTGFLLGLAGLAHFLQQKGYWGELIKEAVSNSSLVLTAVLWGNNYLVFALLANSFWLVVAIHRAVRRQPSEAR